MDELEKGVFVSETTAFGNKEMFKNLKNSKTIGYPRQVKGAIDQILDLIGSENEKNFYLKIKDQKYDLKSLLTARGNRAECGDFALSRNFKNKLFPVLYPEILKGTKVSKFEMQIFLEKLDFFFINSKVLGCPTKPNIKNLFL